MFGAKNILKFFALFASSPWRVIRFIPGLLLVGLLLAPVLVFGLYAVSVRWFYPALLPSEWTLEPLRRLVVAPATRSALLLSLEIALLVSGLSLLIGYPAGRVLGTQEFRGKALIYLLLFVPTVVPSVALGIGLNIVFLRLGLSGTLVGVALVHSIPVLPYVVFTLAGVFANYDPHFEYQARLLGAGSGRVFWQITLPMVLPGLVVAGLFAFLISWSQYLLTLLIGGGQVITLPLLLFASVAGGNPATISGLALLFAAPLVIIIALTARYLAAERILLQ